MRSITMLVLVLLLAFSAATAFAQCSTCQTQNQATVQSECGCQTCQPCCPATCAPCCPTTQLCPQAKQCPCPIVNPAAIGAGPAPDLSCLSCADFDKAYAQKIYNQNMTIAALATEGIQRASNKNLRDISGEIRTNVTSENVKLSQWNAGMGNCSIQVDTSRGQTIIESLASSTGDCFDVAYAQTMINVLVQSRDSNMLAVNKSALPEIQRQAKVALSHENDEIMRLQRWLKYHGVCPPAIGSGPCNTCPPRIVPAPCNTCPPVECPTCPTPKASCNTCCPQ